MSPAPSSIAPQNISHDDVLAAGRGEQPSVCPLSSEPQPMFGLQLCALQNITDEDVLALVNDEVHQPEVVWVLEDLQASISFFLLFSLHVLRMRPDE